MTGKTKKELQIENDKLREEISNLKSSLEGKKVCRKCEKKTFGNSSNMKEKETTHTMLKCAYCEKEFNEEWKKQAHMQIHKKYPCNVCDKTFKYLDIMNKHVQIVHEKAKLYCHFFNNKKTCPYDKECVFLHENSKLCKYGSMCDRNY